jgi:hypothetical protein
MLIRLAQLLCGAAALSVAACAPKQATHPLAVEDLDLRGVGIDELKGGYFVVLDLTDGSRVSRQDGMVHLNGEKLSCAELKMKVPYLFQSMANRGPFFDNDCRTPGEQGRAVVD